MAPNPFTPNADGINDEVEFTVDVYLLTDAKDVVLQLYDLSGRRVTQVLPGPAGAGTETLRWDGTDDDGALVPPGLYVYRLEVRSDATGSRSRTGTVAVAY